jgi:hemoglobin-like flavoprotein
VHNVSEVRQTEIHTYNKQILAEQIQAGGETLLSAIQKLINSVWKKEELSDQWMESIIVPINKISDETD